jgi:hypothetical protein
MLHTDIISPLSYPFTCPAAGAALHCAVLHCAASAVGKCEFKDGTGSSSFILACSITRLAREELIRFSVRTTAVGDYSITGTAVFGAQKVVARNATAQITVTVSATAAGTCSHHFRCCARCMLSP